MVETRTYSCSKFSEVVSKYGVSDDCERFIETLPFSFVYKFCGRFGTDYPSEKMVKMFSEQAYYTSDYCVYRTYNSIEAQYEVIFISKET